MVQFSLHVSLIFPFFSVVIVVIIQYSSCHTMIWVIQAQLSGLQIMDKICITKKKQSGEEMELEASISFSS